MKALGMLKVVRHAHGILNPTLALCADAEEPGVFRARMSAHRAALYAALDLIQTRGLNGVAVFRLM